MTVTPAPAEFARLAGRYRVIPVWRDLLADTLTPVEVFRRVGAGEGSVLLERVDEGERRGRFSLIGVDPVTTLLAYRDGLRWTDGPVCPVPDGASLAETLRVVTETLRAPPVPDLPGWSCGMVCVLGGDAFRTVGGDGGGRPVAAGDPRPGDAPGAPDGADPPDSVVTFPRFLLVLDHFRQRLRLVATVLVDPARPAPDQYAEAVARLDALVRRLRGPAPTGAGPAGPAPVPEPTGTPAVASDIPDPAYREMIAAAHHRVRAGELRQVTVSRRFTAPATADPLAVYRALRVTNPSPYLFLCRLPGVTLVGASPQGLVRVRGRAVTNHVLAGTRPRGGDAATDEQLAAELLADPKERDEHDMLVELALADLTPVAEPGTVGVARRHRLVRYARVMHLASEVTGTLAEGRSPLAALAAVFPAGTVAGTPRAAALRVIDEVEPRPRGLYGGAVGFVPFTGDLDVCLGIRTLQFRAGTVVSQAGAGVVADSEPDREVRESWQKASALFAALTAASELT